MSRLVFYWMTCAAISIGSWSLFIMPAQASPTLTQSAYRFYVNEDSQEPADPWPLGGTNLAENTPITVDDSPPGIGDVVRIRINIAVTNDTLVNQTVFRLQYGQNEICSNVSKWKNVGGFGGSELWNGYDNQTPTEGETLNNTLLSSSNIKENYEEENDSYATNDVQDGEFAEWDWVIINNSATEGAPYCFRMVLGGEGTSPLSAYDDYPQLVTEVPISSLAKSQDWQFFGDAENETPVSSLSAVNVRPIGVRDYDQIKLRMTLKEVNGAEGLNKKYSLQFDSTDEFLNPVYVEESDFCTAFSLWCYTTDGVDTDDDAITTLILPDSDLVGRHNETGYAGVSTFTHSANAAAEMEFTIKSFGALPGTDFVFRLVDAANQVLVETNTGETYPSVRTRDPYLSFMVEGLDAGTLIDGYTTNIATTADGLEFGPINFGVDYISGQRLRVTQDALGYQVSVFVTGPFQSIDGTKIEGIDGTNASPIPWGFTPSPISPSIFGYHTSDDILSDASTRFQADDTWAALSATAEEIIFTSGAVENDVNDIIYRLNVSGYQAAQQYETQIIYVVVGTY